MMSGAEGERRLDLDADAIRRNARAVVRPMHGEAACLNGLELSETRRNPVLGGDLFEGQPRGAFGACQLTHRQSHRLLVRWRFKVDLQVPTPVCPLERGSCRLVKTLGKRVDEALRARFVADEPGEGRL